jgi:luciferase family oxidoreductase group 1
VIAAMSSDLRLSVLDQSMISEGSTGSQALRNTIDLARLADELGYHRYWVAEHHGERLGAGPAPEALIGPIAAVTEHLLVGSGGVMLPHYSPFKVAEVFSVLAGLFPGRIDLAVGRANGTDPLTAFALQRDRRQARPDDFPQQLAELLGYIDGTLPEDFTFARLATTLPGLPEAPKPWLLGSSPQSAIWAGELGLPYAFAHFINPGGVDFAGLYRERFTPGAREPAPRTIIGVLAVCAESEQEAREIASSTRMAFTLLRAGTPAPLPPPDKALRFLEQRGETSRSDGGRVIYGTPDTVRLEIERLADVYGAEEAIVVTPAYDHEARRRSYELLADVFSLTPRDAGVAAG